MEHEILQNKTPVDTAAVAIHDDANLNATNAPQAGMDAGDKNSLESLKPNDSFEDQKTTTKPNRDEPSDIVSSEPSSRILHGPTFDGDSVDFPLSNLQDHLICPLCGGYFRDPYTVADCLHSFCRSCLIVHFRVGHRRCPTWSVLELDFN